MAISKVIPFLLLSMVLLHSAIACMFGGCDNPPPCESGCDQPELPPPVQNPPPCESGCHQPDLPPPHHKKPPHRLEVPIHKPPQMPNFPIHKPPHKPETPVHKPPHDSDCDKPEHPPQIPKVPVHNKPPQVPVYNKPPQAPHRPQVPVYNKPPQGPHRPQVPVYNKPPVTPPCESGCNQPHPQPRPRSCSVDEGRIGGCHDLLGGLLFGRPLFGSPCCGLFHDLDDDEQASCACGVARRGFFGSDDECHHRFNLLANHCGCSIPSGFRCGFI